MSVRNAEGQLAFINARLLDPATGLDAIGGLLIDGELIAAVGPHLTPAQIPDGIPVMDAHGLCLAPGLVDMRVQLREPGEEHKETLRSAGESAVAGGITSMVCLPNTEPVIDDVATVEFVARRARLNGLAKVYPYAAATKNMEGQELSEMGMLAEAGALAALDDRAHYERSMRNNSVQLASLHRQLRELGYEPPESWGNFLYVDTGEVAAALDRRLQRHGVIVRPLTGSWSARTAIRVTVGSPEDNRKFIDALKHATRG